MTGRPQIVLGVSGGIAAYKAAELVRLLVKDNIEVRVVMTRAATHFLAPLTLQTLSGHPVLVHLFEKEASGAGSYAPEEAAGAVPAPGPGAAAGSTAPSPAAASPAGAPGVDHIDVIKDAALTVVAPATANILAKAAHGIGDDALSTVLLAAGTRVLFAPAMNHRMWNHPATRDNVALLRGRGYHFVEPGEGYQACGETGVGRMAEPAEIRAAIRMLLAARGGLEGRRVVITAGRTEEPIDPVRVLTNRSSGRMGVALAEEARDRGAQVTLVAGVLSVPPPAGVEMVSAPTAEAMRAAVAAHFPGADVLVMAAAVADFRPAQPAGRKIRRASGLQAIELEPTVDIVREAAAGRRPGQVVVGFALETEDGEAGARRKLQEKGLDLVALNNPTEAGSEFGGDTDRVTIFSAAGEPEALPLLTKREVAGRLFERVIRLLPAPRTAS